MSAGGYRRRVPYIPNPSAYKNFYSGAGLPVFQGTYQDGSGLLGNIFRTALPILKPFIATAGKTLLKSGAAALQDIISGERDVKTALRTRGLEGLKQVGSDIGKRFLGNGQQQKGGQRRTARRKRTLTTDIFDSSPGTSRITPRKQRKLN